ncbi:phage tail tip lysozyme [Mesorhizobium sp. M1E.F.Ca.ET.045.02.1.1]|uniref:phage tail tip lysozyme n=1 Tax=Mesorhizobium sp. M1E.F.Ca.ET.045.02.1.1 TaxID=2493672 RepID=UPI0016778A66|nr:phage tail tip lysozyme [Mesorhizobium sp. M1E.F.Ca.ET.045.02.1.1]
MFSALFGGGSPASATTTSAGSSAVASALGGGLMGSAPDLSKNDIYNGFMDTVKTKVTNPNALAAIAATGNAESSFSPKRAFSSWSDPSESGQAGTAGGILSWRGPRFEAMRAFAGSNGGDANAPSPQLQAQYFLQEDPGLVDALNAAKSPEEAQRLMNNAWKFAGYNRPGGEAARRISMANSFASQFSGSDAAPVQVASLEPGAGVSAALNKRPLPQEYASKGVSQDQWDKMNAPDSPAVVAQPIQSPRAAAPAPAAQTAQVAPTQVAGGPSVQQLLQASQDPRLSEQQRGVVNLMLKQKLDEANPANQLELEKNRLEVEKLRNPQIEPGDKARLDLDREKFAAEKNKPIEVGGVLVDPNTHEPVYTGQQTDWEKLDERTLYNKRTGETRAVSIGGANAGQFRFTGNSVEAQALNGLMDGGGLTVEQAQQLAAGKTISGPNGELLFLTPQGVFGQASAGGPATPVTPPKAAAPAPAPAPPPQAAPAPNAAPATQPQPSPTPASPRADSAGILPLTAPKSKPPNEQQQRDNKLYSVVAPELQIVEQNFAALSNPSDQALSAIPHGSDYGAEYLKSPEYQRASNSLRTIIASYLYSVSGATAAPAEVENQAAILTPKPGEAKASLDDKLARIRQMVDAIKTGGSGTVAAPAGTGGGTTSKGLQWSIEP